MKKIKQIVYIAGVVQDPKVITDKIPVPYSNLYCHHMTIQYGNVSKIPAYLGKEFTFTADKLYQDEKAVALTGSIDYKYIKSVMTKNGQKAHITVCTNTDIKPVYSNELIKTENYTSIDPIKIKMKVGIFVIFEDNSLGWLFERE